MSYSYNQSQLRDLRRLLEQPDAQLSVEQIRALLAWNETSTQERERLRAMLAAMNAPPAQQ